MKISKKVLSLILAMLMIASCTSVAFAAGANYSGLTTSSDVSLNKGDTLDDSSVFTGTVTINSGCTVSAGTFKGKVINNGYITGGKFSGEVSNNSKPGFLSTGGIAGGEFTGKVVNKGSVSSGTFKGSFVNESDGEISLTSIASFYCPVTNNGSIKGGSFGSVIENNATIGSTVSAIIYNSSSSTYTVQGSPDIFGSAIINKGNGITIPEYKTVNVKEGGSLTISVDTTLNGTISVEKGGSLVLNGNMNSATSGAIYVDLGGSISGTKVNQFNPRIYKEHSIKVESNIDKELFSFSVSDSAYYSKTVLYSLEFKGENTGCLAINNITVYEGRKNDKNIISKTSDSPGSFTMPDNDVIIYVDLQENHVRENKHVNPTCTQNGYDGIICSVCKREISGAPIPALGHQYTDWTRNTDPSSKLLKSRTCTRCNYVDNSYIEIKGYDVQDVTVDYRSSLTFHYNVSAPDGCYIQWQIDGKDPISANENGYTISEAKENFEIKAIIYSTGIGGIRDEYVVKVTVKNGFFDKFVAFFKGLFKALPVYVDRVKK